MIVLFMLRTLASCWNMENLDILRQKERKVKRPAVTRNRIQDTWLVQPVLCSGGCLVVIASKLLFLFIDSPLEWPLERTIVGSWNIWWITIYCLTASVDANKDQACPSHTATMIRHLIHKLITLVCVLYCNDSQSLDLNNTKWNGWWW